MREIDNNMNSLGFKGTPANPTSGSEPVVSQGQTPNQQGAAPEINDLKNMPVPGQSQVQPDNVDADMALLLKNFGQITQLNLIFDEFLKNHTYEEATQLLEAYKKEFLVGKN